MKRYKLTKGYLVFFLLFFGPAVFAQEETPLWWKDRPLRIYHPNMREIEAKDLDVKQFIRDCQGLHAEAIVFSVGGAYAFYNTKIPYHKKSPHMGNRDLLLEVVREASKADIRVIARLDFSIANQDVFKERPEWFYLDDDGKPIEKRSATGERFFRTALLEEYRNEAFAMPVLRELVSGYEISGMHLNAPGFIATNFREETTQKYNIPEGREAQKQWREERLAAQMIEYRNVIHERITDALFMAEINSPENPGWGARRGFNHELLAGSYTNLLSTAGEPDGEDRYRLRWWSALAADWSHASRSAQSGLPLINLKVGHQQGKLSLKPIEEYRFNCYQAIAHNAGIKAPTYGLIGNMPDSRTASMISVPFQFMERCEDYLTDVERIAPVALVWPAKPIEGLDPASMRDEMLGLYSGLVSGHVLFEIVLAHRLPEDLTGQYGTVIIPSMGILTNEQAESLQTFVEAGGNLVLLDAFPDPPMPGNWGDLLGAKEAGKPYTCAYAFTPQPSAFGLPEAFMVDHEIRHVSPPEDAEIWYKASPSPGGGNWVPEVFPVLEQGEKPMLFSLKQGKGTVVYFAGPLGSMIWDKNLPDYHTILEQMVHPPSGQYRILRTDAPGTVNITAYRSGPKWVIHLVNGTGPIPLNSPTPIGPIRLKVLHGSINAAKWLAPARQTQTLDFSSRQGWVEINIGKLEAYGILVLE